MANTKQEMYERYEKGLYGNKLRTWPNLHKLTQSDFKGQLTARSIGVGGGGKTGYNIPSIEAAVKLWHEWDISADQIAFNESAPDDRILFQGEVMRGVRGLTLRISTRKAKMRVAMLDAVEFHGIWARDILLRNLTPNAYDNLMELLDVHASPDIIGTPNNDTVIEFGVYEMPLGSCRHSNCVVWEVRRY